MVERLTLDYILVEYRWQDDAPPWPSTMFKAGVLLNLTAVVKTGKADSFNLFVGDKELTDTLPSIFHTFHSVSVCILSHYALYLNMPSIKEEKLVGIEKYSVIKERNST